MQKFISTMFIKNRGFKKFEKKVSLKMDLNGIINILFLLTKTKIDFPRSFKADIYQFIYI